MTEIRILVLGGSTTNEVVDMLELFLLNQGIKPSFLQGEYNRYYEEAVFPTEEMACFNPDVIYIHTSIRNIQSFPTKGSSKEAVTELLEREKRRLSTIWSALETRYQCAIIQNNFELPALRPMGNRECFDASGSIRFVNSLNEFVADYAESHRRFYINDINYVSARYGLDGWHSNKDWCLYKYCCSIKAIPFLSFNLSNIIKGLLGKNKKGLVLDLDNTLWGGVVGDDGVDGIAIGPETAVGEVYLGFQEYLKELQSLGLVLAVDSKNDMANALAGLNHPSGILKPADFVSIKANWDPKHINLVRIAEEINLLPDSLVFVDDNPAEREIVRANLPSVSTPELVEPECYESVIDHSGYFEIVELSQDDLQRNEMYRANAQRAEALASFKSYDEYLRSLEMKAVIEPFPQIFFSRIAQLTNKSNQFNLTTKRFTESQIAETATDSNRITLCGRLSDRFGDNGVVALTIGRQEGDNLHIELWLMSCRVLKRDMECAMMDRLIEQCRERNVKTVYGYYYPTAKNLMVSDFYTQFGFMKRSEDETQTVWTIDVAEYRDHNRFIEVSTHDN